MSELALASESNGGEGNRTPVRKTSVLTFYTFSVSFNLILTALTHSIRKD